ncbi:probable RNA polymerase II nuclear localization protein SLC7A6OS [Nilaparvata lugens]|uniref:probable RNA polymerase II nuclear localization protein SLC7A6OS n=1 Tax=Nilaparvata lugens TaxID=108931 RepID=UPI00193E901F|nr:probable RNA polymerase II nuclear localization protein SLC7A6OS [Nilaparvata lugens]
MAVVRIKRRCNEEPLDILLLTCKKRKTDVEESQKASLFKIAATVNEQDDKALHFAHQFKKDAEQKIKKGNDKFKKVVDKLRKEHKVNSENSRLKVVNCYRALNEAELLPTDDGKEKIDPDPGGLTVLDVETCQESQEKATEASASVAEGTYVYDIYYTADGSDLSDVQIDHELSVYPMDSDLSSYLCADIDVSDSEAPDDEDDSNDENNWRNDYPDEEDFSR